MTTSPPPPTNRTVGPDVYRPEHGADDDAGAVVIDLAQARERLASLRGAGAQKSLTRQDSLPVGDCVPAHREKPTSVPALHHPLIDAVLPDRVAAALPTDGSPRTTGQLTHLAISILSATAHDLHPDSLVEAALVLCRAVCPPGRLHRRMSTLVAGYTVEYLRGPLRPRPPWVFVGSEVRTGSGRVDLVWRHNESGAVLFDEIKTTEVTRRTVEPKWIEQCLRYTSAGVNDFGDSFLGVRLLPLGSMNVASFVTASGDVLPLAPTWDDPMAGTGTCRP